jgi:formylglycine-generating enzyme required for sulfatase activity
MSRNYGSLGRRSGNAAWQWVVIGLVIGVACSATVFLAGLAAGVVGVSGQGAAFGPTNTPFIITATPLPATETPMPTEVIITPTSEVVIEAPSPTPTTNPTELTPLPTATPEATATTAAGGQTGGQTSALSAQDTSGAPPDVLVRLASELLPVSGGEFNMGTTPGEAAIAVRDCQERDGGSCLETWAEDSVHQHLVTLSPFQIESTEVTYEQYLAFLNWMGPGSHANGCDGQPCLATRSESETSSVTFDSANYDVPDVINRMPVVEVTWYGAKAYCEALGRRLPTEAEWELAAKGVDGYVYPWGNDWNASNAWTSRSAPDDGEEGGPVAVDSFPLGRSPVGALNMAGNVAEWVSDWYDANYYFQADAAGPDPVGPPLGDEKVVRGGSWPDVPFFARTVHRQSNRPGDPTAWIGFRCAADAEGTGNQSLGAQSNLPIGAEPIVQPTQQGVVDPSTLGQTVPPAGDEGDLGNSAPTLAPPPTRIAPTPLPGGEATPIATLVPS